MAYDVLPRRGSAPTVSFPSCPLGWLIDDSLKAAMQVPPGEKQRRCPWKLWWCAANKLEGSKWQ